MCAILGAVYKNQIININKYLKSLNNMLHRGPDYQGYWLSEKKNIFFGHNRLSILDLSKKAVQPMFSNDKERVIVFNGEIYNFLEIKNVLKKKGYSFFSNSDTEIILCAYEEWDYNFINKIEGQFAFSIFDKKKNIIFSARDRSGEKPFFYKFDNHVFKFSSELKGMFEDEFNDTQIDKKALDCFLTFGYVPDKLCILKGFNKLPPASALIYDLNKHTLNVYNYWNLPNLNIKNKKKIGIDVLHEEFDFLMMRSVKKQLTADVPVGILLSGGIDSSLVTYYASKLSQKIKTFNVSFSSSSGFDESGHALFVSKILGTDHTQIDVEEPSPEIMFKLCKQFDEPIADSSMVPSFLLSEQVKKFCTVALGGDGGDELFAGYKHYDRMLWIDKHLSFIPKSLRLLVSRYLAYKMPMGFKGRNWLQSLDHDFTHDLPNIGKFYNKMERKQLTNNYLDINFSEHFWRERTPKDLDLLERATKMDFKNYLPEDILVKIDRVSMLNSLEIRAPFLDSSIIEFAFNKIHSNQKCDSNQRKIFLKKFINKIFPQSFNNQRKQGFSIPLKKWFRSGEWRNFLIDHLINKDSFFCSKSVEKIIKYHDKGCDNTERLFSLLIFELWRKHYKVRF